jgi:wyosine [tRNA(Phe)-imidazoG37] synthetase (radical SAM superfamily)
MRALDFRDHSRDLRDNRHVYAVVSRRSRGLSIGVNLNADKVCNFACPYCQVDRTTPGGPRSVDLDRLRAELDHLLDHVTAGTLWEIPPFSSAAPAFRRVNDIAFAGDGEPTTARDFAAAVTAVAELREAHKLDHVDLQLLTNATLFHRPAVWAGLEALHQAGGTIVAKLDAGTQAYFEHVDGTTLPLRRVLDNIRDAGRAFGVTLQCMFMAWDGVGPTDAEIVAWTDQIRWLLDQGARLDLVQVYSVARTPADPRVGPLSISRLQEIAAQASALNVNTAVFPGLEPEQDS